MSSRTILINGIKHELVDECSPMSDLAPLFYALACGEVIPRYGYVIPNTDIENLSSLEGLNRDLQMWLTSAISSASLLLTNVSWTGASDLETQGVGHLFYGLVELQKQVQFIFDHIDNTREYLTDLAKTNESAQ